jgi:cytochrome c553
MRFRNAAPHSRVEGRVRPLPFLMFALLLAACEPADDSIGRRLSRDGETIALGGGDAGPAHACFSCHGLRGEGDGAAPRLAGADAGDLIKQLTDYGSGLRPDPVMAPIARRLDSGERARVAAFYAALPPPRAEAAGGPAPAAWFRGPHSCASCHGVDGAGAGAGMPAVSGQPADYVLEQIDRWRSGKRRNDPGGVMRTAVAGLSEPESRAIALWLSRGPTVPSPASAEPTASAAASARERPAASRAARRPDR